MAAGGLSPPLSDPARPASLAERGAAEPPHAGWRRPALLTRPTEILTARGLLLGAIFIAAVRLVVLPVEDPDYWWHFAIGRWMLEHRSLPSHDVFTYVVTTHVWVDHEYLTEVGIYLLQTRFGLAGVSLFFGAVTLAALWLVYRRSQLEPQPYVITGLLLALAVAAGGPIWGPRAQMLSFLFVCLELYWLERFLLSGDRRVYWLAPVMILWANLHGGFVIAFLFLGLAVTARLVEWVVRRQPSLLADARRLLLLTAACGIAGLLTPNTYKLYLYALQTQGSPAQQSLIIEWLSPDFHQANFRPFELMVLALLVGFALSRPRLYEVLLALSTLALALHSGRHIALFVAACTPVLIRLYGEAWRSAAARRGWRLPRALPSPRLAATTAAALLIVGGVIGDVTARHLMEQDAIVRAGYPVAAADWIAVHPEVGTRMFNSYGWGGYLAYRFYQQPERRVAIFGEAALMGDQHLRDYADVVFLHPNWSAQLDREGVDYVLFNRDAPLANALAVDAGWKLVYRDSVAVIYARA